MPLLELICVVWIIACVSQHVGAILLTTVVLGSVIYLL